MESLGNTRREFSLLASGLFPLAHSRGYAFAYNEAKRSDEQAIINSIGEAGRARVAAACRSIGFMALGDAIANNGKANGVLHSVHQLGLALDLDLYKDGVYLPNTIDHKQFGEWWEKQHVLARWGGRWGDGNHYSFEWLGIK